MKISQEAKDRAKNYMRLKNGYKEKETMTPQEKEFTKILLKDFLKAIAFGLITIGAAAFVVWMF